MTYELYRLIFIISAVLAGIFLLVSVLLFIFLHIPVVIGDLTGLNARRAIENIRNQNANSGDKAYKVSRVNRERGKLTDKISASGKIVNRGNDVLYGNTVTEKISLSELAKDHLTNETMLLDTSDQTTVLDNQSEATTVLNQPSYMSFSFEIEYEITYIHTSEIIISEGYQ